jgi:TolB-like protein/DNA-binding winged helix-turn-helix (wHTH) protein/Flp pilus assembly protein TadD
MKNGGDGPVTAETLAGTRELYEFAGFVLNPAKRLLLRNGSEPIALNPKAFDALAYLVARAGSVVERGDLASALWPRTVVEDNNLTQTIAAIRRALNDSDAQQFVATIPRRGYQFVAPVVRRAGTTDTVESARSAAARSTRRYAAIASAMVAVALGVVWWWFDSPPSPTRSSAPPRSVAVLPFANLSPNANDAYFAAGMHEEVLARLARINNVSVIGRTSVLRYANATPDSLSTIASELNVATIMEGSVRFAGNRVRVNVRLVDGAGGAQLWTETYDAELSDVFEIQSDIATRIATALDVELTPSTRQRLTRQPTQSTPAYSAYLRALALYRSSGAIGVSMAPQVRRTIKDYLDEAIALDPQFASALGWRAQVSIDSIQFDSFKIAERDARIGELTTAVARDARDALAIDPALGIAYAALTRLHYFEYRLDDALATVEKAQQLVPDDTTIWQVAAALHCMRNDGSAAIAAAHRAIELDAGNPGPYSLLGIGLRMTGRHEESLQAFTRLVEVAPTAGMGYVGLARFLTRNGDTPQIRDTLKAAEQFVGSVRNFHLDLALSYASIGADDDAKRLVDAFRRTMQGHYVDPALEAMALLATREHTQAMTLLRQTVETRRRGMDQMPLTLIRYNSWSDPLLETQEWLELREALAYKPR